MLRARPPSNPCSENPQLARVLRCWLGNDGQLTPPRNATGRKKGEPKRYVVGDRADRRAKGDADACAHREAEGDVCRP